MRGIAAQYIGEPVDLDDVPEYVDAREEWRRLSRAAGRAAAAATVAAARTTQPVAVPVEALMDTDVMYYTALSTVSPDTSSPALTEDGYVGAARRA
jgi:hypothetical protein